MQPPRRMTQAPLALLGRSFTAPGGAINRLESGAHPWAQLPAGPAARSDRRAVLADRDDEAGGCGGGG